MKKLPPLCIVMFCTAAAMSPASPLDVCTFGPVTFGYFDMGSWENADGTVVVKEPAVGTGHWITDAPSLNEERQDLQRSCDATAETLIRRVSDTFAGTLTHAEIFYDDRAQKCKDHFGEIYDIYTGILCPSD